MKKQLSAIFLLAGIAIGSGMISLPIVLSHIGIIPTFFLILFFAVITYFSAIVRVELNLQSDCSFTLEDVGQKFSGKTAALIGNVCLKTLPLALLSAYIYGLGSMIPISGSAGTISVGAAAFVCFLFSTDKIVDLNNKLFIFLLFVVLISIVCMFVGVDPWSLPLKMHDMKFSKICIILPTLLTSFGFQGSLHSLTKFCNNDIKLIKTACFWGSLIPAMVYLLWTLCIMAVIFNSQPELFFKMAAKGIDVGELITALGNASSVWFIRRATFAISICAIVTSVFGVGIALVEDIEMAFGRLGVNVSLKSRRFLSALMAILPATFVATMIPEAFIKVLGFAGMILTIIAILLPSFLFFKISKPKCIEVLRNYIIVYALVIFGFIIIVCEIASIVLGTV